MLHLLTSAVNSYRLLEFDRAASSHDIEFIAGSSLAGEDVVLRYSVAKKSTLASLRRGHYLESLGPTLVTSALRAALVEQEQRGEVEFYDVELTCGSDAVEGFVAMNVRHRVPCTDLGASEFSVTNFDPDRPTYDFDFHVLRHEFEQDLRIAVCDEMPRSVVVVDAVLDRLRAARLSGLVLYSALDHTMLDRSVRVRI